MPKESFEVLMIGCNQRFFCLRHNILRAEVNEVKSSWQLVTSYVQTYPEALSYIHKMQRLDLVFVYNDFGLSPRGLGKFCKVLAEALAEHPNKPTVGIDSAVLVGEAEEGIAQIFKGQEVSVMYGDIGDIFVTVMRAKANHTLN